MASNCPLGDLVASMNVGSKSRLECMKLVYSNAALGVLEILQENGVIRGFSMDPSGAGFITVHLKYVTGNPVFSSMVLLSSPGRSVYWTLSELSLVHNANTFSGFYILTSHHGLIASNDALMGMYCSGEILIKVNI